MIHDARLCLEEGELSEADAGQTTGFDLPR